MIPFDAQTSQALIDNMSYAVICVDRDGIINHWNKAAELMLGFSASEALGQHANLVIPTNMQHIHGPCFSKSQDTVKGFALKKDVVLPFMHKSGLAVKMKGHATIIRDADGVPMGSAVIGSNANE